MSLLKTNDLRQQSLNTPPQGARFEARYNFTNSNRTLANNSGWVNHLTGNLAISQRTNVIAVCATSFGYEAGRVEGFVRLIWNGSDQRGSCVGRQINFNRADSGSCSWNIGTVNAGNYSYQLQARNWINGTRWIMNYWSPDQNYTRDTITFWFQ